MTEQASQQEVNGGADEVNRPVMAAQHESTLNGIVDRLESDFGEMFTTETLRHYVEDSYAELAGKARVLTHIPSFVDRFARQRLRALAKQRGLVEDRPAEVLFVCERNDATSQMAAALFNAASEGRGHASSAGTAPADDMLEEAVQVMHEIGLDLLGEFPKPLTEEVEAAADVIVALGAHDDVDVIDGKQYFAWRLTSQSDGLDAYRAQREDLAARVSGLIDAVLPPAPPPTRVAIDRATSSLDSNLSALGELVGDLAGRLPDALAGSEADRQAIVDADDEIDALHEEVTRQVVEIIVRHQPVASDLRRLLAFHDASLHLERVADGLVDVASLGNSSSLTIGGEMPPAINDMIAMVAKMAKDALGSLVRAEADLARQLGAANNELEVIADRLFSSLVAALAEGPSSANDGVLDIAKVGRVLKRCGEHAVDIAEQTLFVVTGEFHELGR